MKNMENIKYLSIDDIVYGLNLIKQEDELFMAASKTLDLLSLANMLNSDRLSVLLESAGTIELVTYLSDLYIIFYKSDDIDFDIYTKAGRAAAIDYTIEQLYRTYYEKR